MDERSGIGSVFGSALGGIGDYVDSLRHDAATSAGVPVIEPLEPRLLLSVTDVLASGLSVDEVQLWWQEDFVSETGFRIERSTDGQNWATAGTVGADSTEFLDTQLAGATTYQYRVQAYDGQGDLDTPGTASATTLADANGPHHLSATAVSTSTISLSWQCDNYDVGEYWLEQYIDGIGWDYLDYAFDTTYTATGLNPATDYQFRVFGYDYMLSQQVGPSNELTVSTDQPPYVGQGTGLAATYYDNDDFTGTTVNRTDPTVDFDWGSGSPDAAIGPDTFSVVWEGQVLAQYDETYTFHTTADDGVCLWVNGQQVVDGWDDTGTTENSGTITLQGGQSYDVRMVFREQGGSAQVKLEWSGASTPRQVIPQTQLYNTAITPMSTPGAPTGLTVVDTGFDSVELSWTDNASDEVGYHVDVSDDAGVTWTRAASTGGATGHTVTGLSMETAYSFRVTAFNTAGTSAASNTASTTTLGDPRIPYGLTSTQTTLSTVALSWQCDSQDVGDFWIEMSTDGTTWSWVDMMWETNYTVTGLDASTDYQFRVFGYDYNLWEEVGPSEVFAVTTAAPPYVGDGTGLAATYYDNDDFTGTTVNRTDPTVDFDWGSGSPDASLSGDWFSAVWEGQVLAQYSRSRR